MVFILHNPWIFWFVLLPSQATATLYLDFPFSTRVFQKFLYFVEKIRLVLETFLFCVMIDL